MNVFSPAETAGLQAGIALSGSFRSTPWHVRCTYERLEDTLPAKQVDASLVGESRFETFGCMDESAPRPIERTTT